MITLALLTLTSLLLLISSFYMMNNGYKFEELNNKIFHSFIFYYFIYLITLIIFVNCIIKIFNYIF